MLGINQDPVTIKQVEVSIIDRAWDEGWVKPVKASVATGKKVAVVGSGPAGLTVAGDLVQKGHAVTVFEALHELGGVLVYGIPEFRLPKDIVKQDIATLGKMGVRFETNVVVGRTVTIDELMKREGKL